MKKHLKAALAAMLALVMALTAIPVSALPRFEAETAKAENAAIEPYWTVPDGYNAHDYNKCVQFLEQTDENGVKNGENLSDDYNPNDPETWGSDDHGDDCFAWTAVNNELRLESVNLYFAWYSDSSILNGVLDLSSCSALKILTSYRHCLSSIKLRNCISLESLEVSDNKMLWELDIANCTSLIEFRELSAYNRIYRLCASGCTALTDLYVVTNFLSELDVSGCTALNNLDCFCNTIYESDNHLTELNISDCAALTWLNCSSNNLRELDLSHNALLRGLRCDNNNLTELDITQNTALEYLVCDYNNLTKLDVTNNTQLSEFCCRGNAFKELDLSNNQYLSLDNIRAEGSGTIACALGPSYKDGWFINSVYATASAGSSFLGWFSDSGELLYESETWDEFVYDYSGSLLIARFSGGSGEPSLPDDVPAEQISDWFPYHSSVTEKNERYTFDYDDSWFFTESDVYQHDLTKMSIRLAMSAKKETDVNFAVLCGRMNYKDVEGHFEPPTEDTIGYAIARKNIVLSGKAISVIVVGVRGSGYGLEWANNGRVGTGIEHEGFSNAAQKVYEGISGYIDSHRSELHSDIKVWIAGFSRAAAVSNITAKKLIDNPVAGMSETDVYAFCFESPYSTRAANASDEKYRGIRSFINRIDFVPYVPLAGWGYKRYGRTYYTPNKMKSLNYDQKKQNMKEEYRNILQAMIENFSPGEINSLLSSHTLEGKRQAQIYQDFCDVLAAKIPDVNDYLIHYQSYVMTTLGNTLGGGSNDWGLEVANLLCNLIMSGSSHLGVELGFVTTAYLHFNKCHFAELCLAWIDSIESEWDMMELNYTNATVTSATSGTKDDAALNISVYDSANTLVAQVINGEVVDDETGICAYIDSNDQLCFDFPAGEDYRIEVSSAADTELAITMTKYVGENNTPEKLVSYFDVALSAGDTCTGIVENINENDEPYSLFVNGEEIEPSADLNEGDQIEHLVDVEVEGGGRVYFPGTFVTGEYAKLRVAFNEENFLGWYLDGELLSTAPEYRIMVTEDMLITAKFSTKLGDVNLDGNLSIADTILIARYALWLIELEAPCDLDGNRLISIADAIVSARYALGLIEP